MQAFSPHFDTSMASQYHGELESAWVDHIFSTQFHGTPCFLWEYPFFYHFLSGWTWVDLGGLGGPGWTWVDLGGPK